MNKKLLMFLCGAVWLALASCQDDDVDLESGLNFAPTVMSVYPKSTVRVGTDFPVKVHFVDGSSSPLSSATLILKDESGKDVFNVTKTISGTKDSVVVAAKDFNAANLPLGAYTLSVSAKDTRDNVITTTSTFKVAEQLYAANYAQMYIAGQFNSWAANKMELIADNTWEIETDLAGGPWKLKNTEDWSDKNWGDDNCDKVMATGNGDIKCAFPSGKVIVTFNDETLAYTVIQAVTFKTELASLYLLGSINNYEGEEPAFKLVADHSWKIAEVRLKAGDKFRFSELPGFGGAVYGAGAKAGEAALKAKNNIVVPEDMEDAYYEVSFNELTLMYELKFLRYATLYLVGGSTSAGWSPEHAIQFREIGSKRYEVYAYLKVDNGFKFLEQRSYDGDWGKGANGEVIQEGESNVTIDADGFYRIIVDFNDNTYEVTLTNWGIAGAALTGDNTGWSNHTDMIFNGAHNSYTWTLTNIALKVGEFKFTANHSFDINMGSGATANSLTEDGGNLKITQDGVYTITLVLDPVSGYTYTVTQ